MKYLWAIFLIGIVRVTAVEKPGSCPEEALEIAALEKCSSDFVCPGSEKCCDGTCAMPVCDDAEVKTNCSEDVCEVSDCTQIPSAQCYPNPCASDSECAVVWLTPHHDVTAKCDAMDNGPWKKRKWNKKKIMMRKKRKCVRMEKKGRNPAWCNIMGDKPTRWEDKMAQKWAAKKKKWLDNMKQQNGGQNGRWKKKQAKKEARKQLRQEKKQAKENMTPEEKEAFIEDKKQRVMDRLENKKGPRRKKLEKILTKIERKQEVSSQ